MITLKKDNECVVCGKCVISCPKGAICYKLGKYGNYFPVIDEELCVKCHICEQVCEKEIDFDANYLSSQYYIGYYKNEVIRENSSSGGIFSALAMYILQHHGEIIGATYDKDTQLVKHISVSREEDLKKLRKSKYVQSDWIGAYKMIKEAISLNKWILVSGTPCQIETLKECFCNYEKIFFVDLFCHGVTMAKIFRDYINSFEGRVRNIDFRHQKQGEDTNFTIRILQENGNVVEEEWGQNILCELFINSSVLKKSCLTCKYAVKKHKSDITIGDFADWRDYAGSLGISYSLASIISINSKKGMQLFEAIQEELVFYQLEDIDIITSYYGEHEHKYGDWGYEKNLWEKFNRMYLKKGFIIAAIELLYNKELELIYRIDKIKEEGEDLIIYGAGIIGKRINWMISMLRESWNIRCFVETKKVRIGLGIFQ